MQEALRRQEAARRSFVSTASHELRTPLTMLQGTMELLEEDLRDGRVDIEDAQLQVTNARRELRRLSTLAGELLDLSRLDAAVQLRSEPVELGEMARAVAAEFDLRARELDVELRVLPPPEGCWGRGDPDAVARVVRILLDNALRYGPHGQVITITTTCSAASAGVSVTDRGPGIPPEEREHVFERFHRGRAAGPESGFGLGLAIGRELAEQMGGSLELADREPPGACFVLTLAAAEAEDSGPAAARNGCYSAVLTSTVACCAFGRRSIGSAGSTALTAKRESLEMYWRHSRDLQAHELGPRRLPALDVEEDRRHQRDALSGLELVEQRREVALGRGRRQPLGAVAPVGHARVPHGAGERREAHAVGKVVVEHGDLLGLGGDHEVAGAQARRDRPRHLAHVALVVGRPVADPQHGGDDQAGDPEPAGVREPGRDGQQQRRRRDRQVAAGPRRRELRRQPRERDRQQRDRQQPRRGRASPGRRSSTASPAPAASSSATYANCPSIVTGVPSRSTTFGDSDHGAPVWAAW